MLQILYYTVMASSNFYKSVNGYKVFRSAEPVKIDPKIKDLLTDPISLDYYKKPVFVTESKMIYDLSVIRKWFTTSDKDPLTGINIDKNKIQIIPVLPYFLALLCLEQIDDDVYFHPPMGNIFDMLSIAKFLFEDRVVVNENKQGCVKKKDDGKIWKYKLTNGLSQDTVSLNLNDYFQNIFLIEEHNKSWVYPDSHMYGVVPRDDIDVKYNNECFIDEITLEDIIATCPVSRRTFIDQCRITKDGLFIHSVIDGRSYCSSLDTVSNYCDCNFEPDNIIKITPWNNYFDNYSLLKPFTVIHKSSFSNRLAYVDYNDIKDVDIINTVYTKYKGFGSYRLENIFKKLTESVLYNGSRGGNDCYLEVTSTKEKIYQFYKNNRDTIDKDVVNCLSNILDTMKLTDFGPKFIKKREFFGIPSILVSEGMTYGNDYSFLKIKNKSVKDGYFKMVHFVGTQFENVEFINCQFACCSFTGADLKTVKFINCKFSECSFYETTCYKDNFIN